MAENQFERKSGFPVLPLAFLVVVAAGVLWWLRRPLPDDTVRPSPTPTATAQVSRPVAASYTIYVPNDQALLTRKTITEKSSFSSTPSWSLKANRALELLCSRLTVLPRTTKVLSPPKKDAKGVVTVNMSNDFMKLNSMHETSVGLVLDAIASTLGAVDSPDGKPARVRILVEGKPITTLSEYDLSDVWTSSQPLDETPPRPEDVS